MTIREQSGRTAARHPALPAQAAFRTIDRAGRGLTTVITERALVSDIDVPALARAVTATAARHEALSTTVQRAHDADPSDPGFLWTGFENVVNDAVPVVLEQGARLGRPPRADPSRLPVFRLQLVTDDAGAALRIVTDHALCDRWSLLVLCRDIELAYGRERVAGDQPPAGAFPFSRFVGRQYRRWQAGEFDSAMRSVEKRILRAQPPDVTEAARLDRRPLTHVYDLRLGRESAKRFEAIRAHARSTRFVVALALFFAAINVVFGWRDLIALVPSVNRPREAWDSVGLYADSRFVICRLTGDFYDMAREISSSLADMMRASSPPAALVQGRASVREVLASFPRVTGDMLFDTLPADRPAHRMAQVFAPPDADGQPADDVIEPAMAPIFPAQPDLRLTCSFSGQHRLSIAFRVDRILESDALSVAQAIAETLRRAC